MTLLMWLGLKPDVNFPDLHDAASVCTAAPPGNPQLPVSNVQRMEPIPPG
jgi:hypothetical protein